MEIIETADGSTTLYRADIDEHYHSVKGAVTESEHVYVECALQHWRRLNSPADRVRVLEVGFGTGLNASLTAETGIPTHYTSYELYPLDMATAMAMGYGGEWMQALHMAEWNKDEVINDTFTLCKRDVDFLTAPLPAEEVDVVYFDAFAPEKQSQMWTPEVFSRLYNAMSHGGVLTTYCAKGAVRRMLQSAGFTVERLDGPPGGKREILRATKL